MTSDDSHHWMGLKPEPENYFGFCYELHEMSTGKRYIGKKQYWFSSGKSRKRPTNILLDTWKREHWMESNWRFYLGSSTDPVMKAAVKNNPKDFEAFIISQHISYRDLEHAELDHIVVRKAIRLVDENGERVYYNKTAPRVHGRPAQVYVASPEMLAAMETYEAQGSGYYQLGHACAVCGADEWHVGEQAKARRDIRRQCRPCKLAKQRKTRKKKESTK